jgi:hypothetical protein
MNDFVFLTIGLILLISFCIFVVRSIVNLRYHMTTRDEKRRFRDET